MTSDSHADQNSRAPARRRARVGLRDVAKAAGVSIGTASDALNGKDRVDPATRRQIVATADRLGYTVNLAARHLRRGSTGIIAFAHNVPTVSPVELSGIEYFVQILTSAANAAARHGYALVISPIQPGRLDDLHVDGAIVMDPERGNPVVAMLRDRGIPTVTAGRVPELPREASWWVDNDLERQVIGVLDHLAEQGARSVALVTSRPTRSYTFDSIAGYERWCELRGQQPEILFVDGHASESAAYRATQPLFERPEPPDAIYAPLDRLAVGAQLAARGAGLRVPEDVMVAAGSDSESTRTASPPVTALSLHPDKIGELTIDLLVDYLASDPATPPRHLVVDAEITLRESTARRRG